MTEKVTINEFRPEDMPLSCSWFIVAPPSSGKCGMPTTPVIMANGSIKEVQYINVGDYVMGDDSKPRKVLKCFSGQAQFYKYQAKDGYSEPYYFTEGHTLAFKYNEGARLKKRGSTHSVIIPYPQINFSKGYALRTVKNKQVSFNENIYPDAKEKAIEYLEKHRPKDTPMIELEVQEYLEKSSSFRHHLLGYRTGVEFPEKKVDIEPYFLGLWLGDGSKDNTGITNIDPEITEYLDSYAERLNMRVTHSREQNGTFYLHRIIKKDGKNNFVMSKLREYNVYRNKHIPEIYKTNSKKVRLELLAGLIDTDGYLANDSYYEITQKSEQLANDIVFLARSLGLYISKTKCNKGCMYKGEYREGQYYRMNICSTSQCKVSEIPVKIQRKISKEKDNQRKNLLHYSFTLEKAHYGTYCGIEIDGNHRYLLGDFTVTRNCLGEDTPVMMYDQTIKKVQDIKEGELVMGDDAKPRLVSGVTSGTEELFRIEQDFGMTYVVNKSHILTVGNKEEIFDMSLVDVLKDKNYSQIYKGMRVIDIKRLTKWWMNITITSIGIGKYYGFQVDKNGRFLLGDGTITHNTQLMENLVYHLKHRYPVARVFIKTEKWYKRFCDIFGPLFVSNYWNEEEEKQHVLRQRKCEMENGNGYPGNYAVNLLDDIGDDPKVYRTPLLRGLFKLGSQHWAQLLFVATQYAIDVPPDVRKSVSYVGLGREPEEKERKKLYENFGGLAGSYNKFCDLMDQLTGDYTFLIFQKRSQSNKLEDCVFFFRTWKNEKIWKFGCKEFRDWNKARYNTNYVEKIIM